MRDWWKLNKDIHFLHYIPESDAYTQCGSTSRRLKFKIFVPLTKQLIESLIRLTPEIKNNKRGNIYIYICLLHFNCCFVYLVSLVTMPSHQKNI